MSLSASFARLFHHVRNSFQFVLRKLGTFHAEQRRNDLFGRAVVESVDQVTKSGLPYRAARHGRRVDVAQADFFMPHMAFLFKLADRVSVIHWGQVIQEGTPEELRANDWVRRSNLGSLA